MPKPSFGTLVRVLLKSTSCLILFWPLNSIGQEADDSISREDEVIEELEVVGRYRSATTDIVSERIEQSVPVDYLNGEFIARVGDSNVAEALRRLPGLTLVDGKYVYIRGLGERYSNASLNSANVPSPDISRNVIPLDIFPADIIDSVAVIKGYSPEVSASFGGGNIDIRTKRIPESLEFNFGFKTGLNDISDDGFHYAGGSDDDWGVDDGTRSLPNEIADAIDRYQGSFSPVNILLTPNEGQQPTNLAAARSINRHLAASLDKSLNLYPTELNQDIEAEGLLGTTFYLTDYLSMGALILGTYSSDWRNKERTNRIFSNSATNFANTLQTTHGVDLSLSANLGFRLIDEHEWTVTALLLRNSEDDATSSRTCSKGQFNDCFDEELPIQGRLTGQRFEQRQLETLQVQGKSKFGRDTIETIGGDLAFLEGILGSSIDWYYTKSIAATKIPNEIRVSGFEKLASPNGAVQSYSVRSTGTAVDYRFSNLKDEVMSWGYDWTVPLQMFGTDLDISGGFAFSDKLRNYKQISLGLGTTHPDFREISTAQPDSVFTQRNILDPSFGFELLLGTSEFGTESYVAVQTIEARYGKFDLFIDDTWRISGGVRAESFRQISIPINYLEYRGSRVQVDIQAGRKGHDMWLSTDDYYPAFHITYIDPGFWSDEFQFRIGASRTTVRPDIREVSASTFIDPISEARVRGNPDLTVSLLTNFDARAEFFWRNGNSATLSAFYKQIEAPIETVQGGATEDNILFNFINADDASVYGIEFEWMKSLDTYAARFFDLLAGFYVAGNLTLSDSEIAISTGSGVGNITNHKRRLTQQSNVVGNLQIGYDSFDGRYSGTLIYNVFGERLIFAGTDGLPDGYEQPFHSLDLVYAYYPTEAITVKLRLRNMLRSDIQVYQGDVPVIEQDIGTTMLVNFKWSY